MCVGSAHEHRHTYEHIHVSDHHTGYTAPTWQPELDHEDQEYIYPVKYLDDEVGQETIMLLSVREVCID